MDQRQGASLNDILDPPIPGGWSPSEEERRSVDHSATIPGWGSDLDPERRPGVPRDKAPGIGPESLYPPIPPQRTDVLILKSTEHGQLPPVFGTSCPPRGLSGLMRRRAYHFSEGRLARWMLLMAADRVDVAEDFLRDLAHLRLPNVPREMGLKSELRHNRRKLVGKTVIAVAGLALAFMVVRAG